MYISLYINLILILIPILIVCFIGFLFLFFQYISCMIEEHSMQKPVEVAGSHLFKNWLKFT